MKAFGLVSQLGYRNGIPKNRYIEKKTSCRLVGKFFFPLICIPRFSVLSFETLLKVQYQGPLKSKNSLVIDKPLVKKKKKNT